jgi:hypothetical protein
MAGMNFWPFDCKRTSLVKIIFISYFSILFSLNSYSQHNYENPREKAKRGLLEEVEKKVLDDSVEEKVVEKPSDDTPKISKGEITFCACEKIHSLSLKRLKLYSKLVSNDVINRDYSVRRQHDIHKNKAKIALKRIRAKYEIDVDYDCEHSGLSHKKLSQYKKAIGQLVDSCDIDIITE